MTTSHRSGVTICKADGTPTPVHININSNGLVVCKQWKKCPHHGKSLCEELGMHEDVLRLNAFKGGTIKGITHMLNEDKETFMRRVRRSFK